MSNYDTNTINGMTGSLSLSVQSSISSDVTLNTRCEYNTVHTASQGVGPSKGCVPARPDTVKTTPCLYSVPYEHLVEVCKLYRTAMGTETYTTGGAEDWHTNVYSTEL